MGKVVEFTDARFQSDVLDSEKPVFVKFWGPGCDSCQSLVPMVEELAAENARSIRVGRLNIKENPESAERFGVQSVPTIMIFKQGEIFERFIGLQPKARLQESLDAAKG